MNDNYEAIVAGEIPALEQQILNSSARREAFLKTIVVFGRTAFERKERQYLCGLSFCVEFCREKLYVPKFFPDLWKEIERQFGIEPDLFSNMSGITDYRKKDDLRRGWQNMYFRVDRNAKFSELVVASAGHQIDVIRNIIFYRRTVVLQELFQRFKAILAETPATIEQGNTALKWAFQRIGDQCVEERRHRQPLDFFAAKNVQIEGDIYDEAVTLLRGVCLESGSVTNQDSQKIVDQAFQRIADAISNQKEAQKRLEELAQKCNALKLAFPDAQVQIDRLFRQEVEGLRR